MADSPTSPQPPTDRSGSSRRSFFAVVTGALATLTPALAGLATFLSPLLRKVKNHKVRVALLDQVPDDGMPRFFPVIADREDAWNRYPQQRIGAVYLVRQPGEATPTAFTAKCPHAGCFVGYTLGDQQFKCPCHTSVFNLDGSRARGDDEVAPRDMDTLTVELRQRKAVEGQETTEVLVEFVDYQTGRREKMPTV